MAFLAFKIISIVCLDLPATSQIGRSGPSISGKEEMTKGCVRLFTIFRWMIPMVLLGVLAPTTSRLALAIRLDESIALETIWASGARAGGWGFHCERCMTAMKE